MVKISLLLLYYLFKFGNYRLYFGQKWFVVQVIAVFLNIEFNINTTNLRILRSEEMVLPVIGFLPPSAYELRNHTCMIPCGGLAGDIPLIWKDSQLQYYVKYMVYGQPLDSMFKGFIFNGIRTRDNHFLDPLYVGFGEPSEMIDWLQWIDALFVPDANLHALHRLADEEKLDVWVSVPYPHPFQRNFGTVQGRNLDFEVAIDRLTAVLWWLDQFVARWEESSHLHDKLEFRGFLWQREVIDDDDEMIVKWVNASIHSKKLLCMWLPNYGSARVINWRELDFHVVALHSNFSGNPNYDSSWISNACLFSRYYQTGIQVTWGKGMMYNDTHQLDYFNLGLKEYSNYMTDSFIVYQFPNQTMESINRDCLTDYIRLYTFIKGFYQKIEYPGITY